MLRLLSLFVAVWDAQCRFTGFRPLLWEFSFGSSSYLMQRPCSLLKKQSIRPLFLRCFLCVFASHTVASSAFETATSHIPSIISFSKVLARVLFAILSFMDTRRFITELATSSCRYQRSFVLPIIGFGLWTQSCSRSTSYLSIEKLSPTVSQLRLL